MNLWRRHSYSLRNLLPVVHLHDLATSSAEHVGEKIAHTLQKVTYVRDGAGGEIFQVARYESFHCVDRC